MPHNFSTELKSQDVVWTIIKPVVGNISETVPNIKIPTAKLFHVPRINQILVLINVDNQSIIT